MWMESMWLSFFQSAWGVDCLGQVSPEGGLTGIVPSLCMEASVSRTRVETLLPRPQFKQ